MKKLTSMMFVLLLMMSLLSPARAAGEEMFFSQENDGWTATFTVREAFAMKRVVIPVMKEGEEELHTIVVFQVPEASIQVNFSVDGAFGSPVPYGCAGMYRPEGGRYTWNPTVLSKEFGVLGDPLQGCEFGRSVLDRNWLQYYEEENGYDFLPGQVTDILAFWIGGLDVLVGLTCCDLDELITVQSEEEPAIPTGPFTDVAEDAYYRDAVLWAYENGVTNGITATTFGPAETCTRGQVVTFLWRANGCPEPTTTTNPFTDVKESDYYYKAVLWAVEQGITNGVGINQFGPDQTCTSAHVVTFLWRANGEPKAAGESDLAEAGQYYSDAVAWADEEGLLAGTGKVFTPGENSPRADIVTYLYRNSGK